MPFPSTTSSCCRHPLAEAGLTAAVQAGHTEVRDLAGGLDDEQGTAYLHKNLRTYSHYAGTCRIGTDETAVVDPKLRVRGVSGLRVADASVMPSSVSANTNATVYAIAERAADLVRPRS
ncbi:GMC oxidoreductase [Streptomyces mirabilis]|uniref:GMC oxidoreductase n=1 Tax=Streptomyces mirabilis TaxID=68239 RepID=UPI0032551D76